MEILEEIKKMNEEVKSLISKQETEVKANGQANGETAIKLNNAIEALEKKNAELATENEKKEKRLADLEVKMNRPNFSGNKLEEKTIGSMFAESNECKSYLGGMGQKFETKAIAGDTTAGNLVRPDRDQNIYQNPFQLNYISDLFSRNTTNSDSIEIQRELVNTNNAAIQTAQLASKGESNITYSLETYNVRTLANFITASKQVLSDAPRLRQQIDGRLMDNLMLLEDAQVFYGDGTGVNFTGVFVDADVQDAGELPSGTAAADVPKAMIDHIRKALRMLRTSNYGATAIVLSPADYETIETASGSDGHYILMTSPVGGVDRLWRVPIIESNTIVANDFVVGDFKRAGTIYDREQSSIQISDSHASLFIQNGVAILGECRKAFAIELPKALVKGKFTVAV